MAATEQIRRIRLAIIGAGAAGIAVAKNALSNPSQFDTTIFEQNDQLGGIWIYDPSSSTNSPMYKSLRTNTPKELMGYLDYSFSERKHSFLSHEEVLQYLQDYSHHFNILPNIRFSTRVIKISPSQTSNWEIEVENGEQKAIHQFDAVAICSGHYSEPRTPSIPDLDRFQGQVLHSNSYREPSGFAGLRVLCLGAGFSGLDISTEIAKVASKVYLSHNKNVKFATEDNFQDVPELVIAKPTGFCLKDGSFIECDVLMFCTGYVYSFPFLSPDCDVVVRDDYVYPLFKHLINAHRPSMAFFGLPFLVVPFPLMDYQARFFMHFLLGKIEIPPFNVIESENKLHLKSLEGKSRSLRFFHRFGNLQWDYCTYLAKEIGCQPPHPVARQLFNRVRQSFFKDPFQFRNINYTILNTDLFDETDAIIKN